MYVNVAKVCLCSVCHVLESMSCVSSANVLVCVRVCVFCVRVYLNFALTASLHEHPLISIGEPSCHKTHACVRTNVANPRPHYTHG